MFKDFEWQECEVVDSNDVELEVKVAGGAAKKVKRKDVQFHYRNPTAVELESDFLKLPQLDEPNILHSLRCRYWAKEVYSYTGPILIAVNPWQRRDIYTPKIMEGFKSGAQTGPHIFDIASKAFRALHNDRKNQCVLISGESGSGKTESTKYVLQVLTAASDNRSGSSASIEQQVMLTNPVLEAFGNAKTLRNDNSSRFGKWISVHFERKGNVAGAEIQTYLLEKARVVHQGEGERNYHIFYQVCECATADKMLGELDISSASAYNITKTTLKANNTDDTKNFQATKQAMEFIGFDKESQTNIFKALSTILHMGNMEFSEDKDNQATIAAGKHLTAVGKLLSIEEEGFRKSMTIKKISAGGEWLDKPQTAEQAKSSRDALSKSLYSKLFDYVVVRVNQALHFSGENTMQVSVLDIFGFEIFPKNFFEQFCINHANEKLQLHFNHYNFMLERLLYEREGIELVESDFQDNSECVELLEGKGWSIQATIDDVCLMPKGDDATFLSRLQTSAQIKKCKYFVQSKQRTENFTIAHYAGTVSYSVEGFVEKNKDQLPNDIVELMKGSKNPFFQDLFADVATDAPAAGKKSAKVKSLSLKFKEDLGSLMAAINLADPHFVRCVNPNAAKQAETFHDQKVIEQLRCGGVIEAVRMCRESYPSRFKHEEFVNTFSCCMKNGTPSGDSKAQCQAMANELKFDPKHFRLGKTMILLKREVIDMLEKKRGEMLGSRAVCLQNTLRRYLARAELGHKRENRRKYSSVVRLQAVFRRQHSRRVYIEKILAAAGKTAPSDDELKALAMKNAPLSTLGADSRNAVLKSLGDDSDDENKPAKATLEVVVGDDKKKRRRVRKERTKKESAPLCIRIQVHAEGVSEALLFHVDLLASAIKQAVHISEHKTFLRTHPNTFRGFSATEWLRGHAARALFGDEADREVNQTLATSVAFLLAQKLLAVGVFRQVTGSVSKPFEDPSALFRFHEDEDDGPLLNCRTIFFQSAREPLYVASELLHTILQLVIRNPGRDLREFPDYDTFSAATAELQLVSLSDLGRLELLAFFLNCYNLMVLHAHVARGNVDGSDFQMAKFNFVRENQYMIAAYNYSLAEIEERLFCRVLRSKFPPKSDKSRAPEPRVHFALSLGCASSPNIRIYDADTLDEELHRAAELYLQANAPKNQIAIKQAKATGTPANVTLPKLLKWYKDDFGFSKQEILAYYASFQPANLKDDVLEVCRKSSFNLVYDNYDWSLFLSKSCAEIINSPDRKLIEDGKNQAEGMRQDDFLRAPHESISKNVLDRKMKDDDTMSSAPLEVITESADAAEAETADPPVKGSAAPSTTTSSIQLSISKKKDKPKKAPKESKMGEFDSEGFLC